MAAPQRRFGQTRWLWVIGIALIAGAVGVASATGFDPDSDFAHAHVTVLPRLTPGPGAVVVDVGDRAVGRPIAPGFIGLSLEYSAVEPYAGSDPRAVNPVLVELIRGLAPGQTPVLRIGGDSTDWAWWPIPHMSKPAGIRISLGSRFGSVLGALTQALHARLVLGINSEAGSRQLADYEATSLIASVGAGAVRAFELGNEPELYGSWPWFYRADHHGVMARPAGYDMSSYVSDFRRLSHGLPGVGLAGPALGGPKWIRRLGEFVDGVSRLAMVTVHTYPLQRCYTPLVAPTYPTIGHLLARRASAGLAESLAPSVRTAHGHGLPLRVDEINTVSCGGAVGVSNTFASSLWALDTMFAFARQGVDGVNFHTFQDATYRLFRMERRAGRWRGVVAPEYYGLLMFARAAPAGSRLLQLSGGAAELRAWATRTPDGLVHIVLINDAVKPHVVVVHYSGPAAPAAYEALRAPGLSAARGVSLGGVSFGAFTETGILPTPRRVLARPVHGAYVVQVAGASAAMLTLPAAAGSAAPS